MSPNRSPLCQSPRWECHLPVGFSCQSVELGAGTSLPAAWSSAWQRAPDVDALLTLGGDRVTAGELDERSARAAGAYRAAGLTPGDRIVFSCTPGIAMIVAYVGALRAGLTVVPVNPAASVDEIAYVATETRPGLAVVDSAQAWTGTCRTTGPDLRDLPAGTRVDDPDDPDDADDPDDLDRVAPDDIALIVFTSGTTGRPKGALLSHANLLASAHAVRLAWRWSAADRLALALPLFHVHGLGVGLHGTLLAGGSAVVMPRFDPAAVSIAIRELGATMFFGVPTMYHRLAESPHLSDLGSLRLAVSGSAPLSAELHRAIAARAGVEVLERYGMSETLMLVSNPYDGERRPGTVGLPLPGVELRLTGDHGEIEVRGPNVCAGYLGGAGAESFAGDGWFRTGDLGAYDEAGYLRIVGRRKELIITGGLNVYPREIEEVLLRHPSVVDVAVVGLPSAEWGETVAAFVVGSADPPDLEAWCAERLAPYKRPRVWRTADSIPRNAMGKIERHKLTAPTREPGTEGRDGRAV